MAKKCRNSPCEMKDPVSGRCGAVGTGMYCDMNRNTISKNSKKRVRIDPFCLP